MPANAPNEILRAFVKNCLLFIPISSSESSSYIIFSSNLTAPSEETSSSSSSSIIVSVSPFGTSGSRKFVADLSSFNAFFSTFFFLELFPHGNDSMLHQTGQRARAYWDHNPGTTGQDQGQLSMGPRHA